MKKTSLIILALGLGISGLFAQTSTTKTAPRLQAVPVAHEGDTKPEPKTAAEKSKQLADKMTADAKLTQDQHNKIYDALLQYHNEKDQVKKADGGTNSADGKAKIQKLQTALDEKLKTILSADQYQIVQANITNKHSK